MSDNDENRPHTPILFPEMAHRKPIFDAQYMSNQGKKDDSQQKQTDYDEDNFGYEKDSKERFNRLNPYFEEIIQSLRTQFDDYVLPENIYHKLAEAQSISGRADIYSNQLLLTITKLRPLLQKKLGIAAAELKRIINNIIKKVRAARYEGYTLDTIPDGMWFFDDKPICEFL